MAVVFALPIARACPACGQDRPQAEFRSTNPRCHCAACLKSAARKRSARYAATHGEAIKELGRRRYESDPDRFREYFQRNKGRLSRRQREWCKSNPERVLLYAARHRAKKAGLPFDLAVSDIVIPNFCPVLGIRLELGQGQPSDHSPSIDRIVPELGYVRGNIAVISHRANTLKRDGTIEELESIVAWLRGRERR